MARKNKQQKETAQDLRAQILMHARALRFTDLDAYKAWCRAHGFHASLRKSQSQRKREYETFRRNAAENQLKRHKNEGKLRFQIDQIYKRQIKHEQIHDNALLEVSKGFKNCAFPKLLFEILLHLEAKTKFIERNVKHTNIKIWTITEQQGAHCRRQNPAPLCGDLCSLLL